MQGAHAPRVCPHLLQCVQHTVARARATTQGVALLSSDTLPPPQHPSPHKHMHNLTLPQPAHKQATSQQQNPPCAPLSAHKTQAYPVHAHCPAHDRDRNLDSSRTQDSTRLAAALLAAPAATAAGILCSWRPASAAVASSAWGVAKLRKFESIRRAHSLSSSSPVSSLS